MIIPAGESSPPTRGHRSRPLDPVRPRATDQYIDRQWLAGIASALAPMPALWNRLLADHVADRCGLCRACTKGGTGLPGARWPCTISTVAEEARRLHDAVQA